jgi:flagellar P-ring protein precursor FlgI
MSGRFKFIFIITLILTIGFPSAVFSARVKDISSVQGIRQNQLFGYGLVVGLDGSGDNAGKGFTIQSLVNLLERMGINVNRDDVRSKNVAAVMVNATLPPFARIGKKIDVTLSSIGDADSLQGGTLLLTPLKGVNGQIYALAQGAISVGGFSASGDAGGGVQKNHPTVGSITGGATVEREIPMSLAGKKELNLILNDPDFTTAIRMARAINEEFGEDITKPIDSGTIQVSIPGQYQENVVQMIAQINNLQVVPDSVAKVIVNEKTGTVVIGDNVRIKNVAVAHGNLSIQITETKNVSQALPFAPEGGLLGGPAEFDRGVLVAPGGNTVVTPETDVTVREENNRLMLVPEGKTIGELVRALNALGVTPRDLIVILQTIKSAGALQAELEIL